MYLTDTRVARITITTPTTRAAAAATATRTKRRSARTSEPKQPIGKSRRQPNQLPSGGESCTKREPVKNVVKNAQSSSKTNSKKPKPKRNETENKIYEKSAKNNNNNNRNQLQTKRHATTLSLPKSIKEGLGAWPQSIVSASTPKALK